MTENTKTRTNQQRIEDALTEILTEQRRIREDVDLLVLACKLRAPDYAPAEYTQGDTEEAFR